MNRSSILLSLALAVAFVVTVPLCGWFALHSTAFASYLQTTVDRETRPGVLSFGSLAVGPGIGEVTLFDVVMRARTGEEALVAAHVRVRLDTDKFETGDRLLVLPIAEVEIQDFELTLAWDRYGAFNLGDPFRNRAFGLAMEKEPPFYFQLDMPEITLGAGRLHLVWPNFGFHFDQIAAGGAVHVSKSGLYIDVPALDSTAGGAWIDGGSESLRTAIAQHMPDNALTAEDPGLRLPFESVTIRNFRWEGEGFETQLNIAGSGNVPIAVTGEMQFSEDGIGHKLDVDISLPGPLLDAVTRGAATGDARIGLATDGKNLAGTFHLDDLSLDSLRVGPLALDAPTLSGFDIDTRQTQARLSIAAKAEAATLRDVTVQGASAALDVTLGCEACVGEKLLLSLLSPPKTPMGWLTAFPASVQARIAVPRIGARELLVKRRRFESLLLKELTFEGGIPNLSLQVTELSAQGYGRASAQANASLSLGFTERSLKANMTVDVADAPVSALREAFGSPEALAALTGPTFTGKLVFAGDLLRPDTFALATVEVSEPR